jgi:hypothetical protein
MMRAISTLTADDLRLHPVWRYQTRPALDSDEPESQIVLNGEHLCEEVEPIDVFAIFEDSPETLIAATTFRLSTGHSLPGYCSPADPSGLDYIQPVIITPEGHVRLWWDWNPGPEVLDRMVRRLGERPLEVFPISYRCLVPSDGQFLEGVVEHLSVLGFKE